MSNNASETIKRRTFEEVEIECSRRQLDWAWQQVPAEDGWKLVRCGPKHIRAGEVDPSIFTLVSRRCVAE